MSSGRKNQDGNPSPQIKRQSSHDLCKMTALKTFVDLQKGPSFPSGSGKVFQQTINAGISAASYMRCMKNNLWKK